MVSPLTLTLEACSNGVMTDCFFLKAFGKILVAVHKVFDYAVHLNDEFPLLIFLFSVEANKIGVVVSALFAVFQWLQERISPMKFADDEAHVDSEIKQFANPYAAAELQKLIEKRDKGEE